MITKLQPQAVEIEREIIGSILLGYVDISIILKYINPSMFYDQKTNFIFSCFVEMKNLNNPIDLLTVSEYIRNAKQNDDITAYELAQLTNSVIMMTEAKVINYCLIIKEKYLLRELIAMGSTIINKAFDNEGTEEIFTAINLKVDELQTSNTVNELTNINTLIHQANIRITQEADQQHQFNGVDTGFNSLNEVTGGWQKGNLIILAARPSVGKSAFALNLAYNGSKNKTVAFFSLEMANYELTNRLISISTGVKLRDVSRPYLIQDKASTLRKICNNNEFEGRRLFFDDTAGVRVSTIKAKLSKLKKNHGLDLVIIDYLQLIEGDGKGNRENEVSKISRELKKMAKELDVPVIALSQLSRGVEQRDSRTPRLSDLRESGAIEQDADVVMFIYNEETSAIEKDSKMGFVSYIDIQKNRNGALEKLQILKNLSIQKFGEMPSEVGLNFFNQNNNDPF